MTATLSRRDVQLRDMERARIVRIGRRLNLTPRESALVALLHVELTDKVIASKMLVSPNTVRSHLRSIFEKLGVQCRVGAALCWERAANAHDTNQLTVKWDTARRRSQLNLPA